MHSDRLLLTIFFSFFLILNVIRLITEKRRKLPRRVCKLPAPRPQQRGRGVSFLTFVGRLWSVFPPPARCFQHACVCQA